MPRYEYRCDRCKAAVEENRSVENRNNSATHAGCDREGYLRRVFSSPAHSIEGRAYLEYKGDPTDWFAG